MSKADERLAFRDQLLSLGGQAQRLLRTPMDDTRYDPVALARFLTLYADDLEQIVAWRD